MSLVLVFVQSVFFTQFLYLSYVGIVLQMRKNPVKKNDENGLIFNRLVVDGHHGITYWIQLKINTQIDRLLPRLYVY